MKIVQPLDYLKQIVQIDTTNPPGNELPLAETLKNLLDSVGIPNTLLIHGENRANLIAELVGNKNTDKVLGLSGHMDVVPIGDKVWKYPPFSAHEADGKLYGRGTSDMKGGLVALLYAMIQIKQENISFSGKIKFLMTFGEEIGATGAKELVRLGHMDDVSALVIAEPTNNEIYTAEKGVLWLEVKTYGEIAHGSQPESGVNAIEHMYYLLRGIQEEFKMDVQEDELLGKPTLNISLIDGGVNTNVVPDTCRLQIDIRTIPSQSHQDIISELHKLFKTIQCKVPNLLYDMKIINELPSLKTPSSDSFVQFFQKEAEDFFKSERRLRGIPVYTDGAVLKKTDSTIPVVIFGPGDLSKAHETNEHIEIGAFHRSISFFKQIIKNYLK
ncbi:M20 family metallopeptidase [Salinibacillus xinjiangensis]|nr:M20 family metallopeptidase [Salinibacillus xinjiangensis]